MRRLDRAVSCRETAAARHLRHVPLGSCVTAPHEHWRRRSSASAATRIGWFMEVLHSARCMPLGCWNERSCMQNAPECQDPVTTRQDESQTCSDVSLKVKSSLCVRSAKWRCYRGAHRILGPCREGHYQTLWEVAVVGSAGVMSPSVWWPSSYFEPSVQVIGQPSAFRAEPWLSNTPGPRSRSQERGHPLHQNARALTTSGMSSRLHLSKAIRARMKRRINTINANCTRLLAAAAIGHCHVVGFQHSAGEGSSAATRTCCSRKGSNIDADSWRVSKAASW